MDDAIKYKSKSTLALVFDITFFTINYLFPVLYSIAWIKLGVAGNLANIEKQRYGAIYEQILAFVTTFVFVYLIFYLITQVLEKIILRITGLKKTIFGSFRLNLIDVCLAIPFLTKLVKMTKLSDYDDALYLRLVEWSAKQGIILSDINILHVKHFDQNANASCLGIGQRPRIFLLDTLFGRFTNSEIEAIVAHEFGHYQRGDSLDNIYLIVARFLGLILTAGWVAWYIALHGSIDLIPAATIPLILYWICTTPFINSISRDQEVFADCFAVLHISNAAELKNALLKLRLDNFDFITPPKLIEFLLSTYPSMTERIASIDSLLQVISHRGGE